MQRSRITAVRIVGAERSRDVGAVGRPDRSAEEVRRVPVMTDRRGGCGESLAVELQLETFVAGAAPRLARDPAPEQRRPERKQPAVALPERQPSRLDRLVARQLQERELAPGSLERARPLPDVEHGRIVGHGTTVHRHLRHRGRRSPLDRRLDEGRLGRLRHLVVALPALVLELDVLDRDGVGVGVEVGQRLELRDPAADRPCRRSRAARPRCRPR